MEYIILKVIIEFSHTANNKRTKALCNYYLVGHMRYCPHTTLTYALENCSKTIFTF